MRVRGAALRERLAEERGITVILTIVVLVFAAALLAASLDAVYGDARLSRNDLDQKRAYSAAEAGLAVFSQAVNANVNYWESCPSATNATVPGSTDNGSTETYSYSIVPASGQSACDSANPISSIVESSGAAAGTFRVRSTGTSNGVSRTLVAQYGRTSFLNFIYYTDYETLDPLLYTPSPTDCQAHYPSRGSDCTTIDFVTGDVVSGPLHSEDTLAICGSPTFGRTAADAIQAAGFSSEGQQGCSNSATFTGTANTSSPSLTPPPSDVQLYNLAAPAYRFTGQTTIVLNGASMTVTNANISGGTETIAFPSNGVVYVSSSSCPVTYSPYGPDYTANTGCGNVFVSGNYTSSLTIGSDNDVIINGNITTTTNSSGVPTTSALLGLVANQFVRVYHPMSTRSGSSAFQCGSATNSTGSMTNPVIYAAILAVKHSFIVDNYDCGASLGSLKIYGAIGQLFRGTVGSSGQSSTGYLKNYVYDDRLAAAEPPYFIDPVEAAWHIQRQTECTGC